MTLGSRFGLAIVTQSLPASGHINGSARTVTLPTACATSFQKNYYVDKKEFIGRYDIAGPLTTDGCFPTDYNPSRNYHYSPGVCPAGFTTACSLTVPGGDVIATCCPLGYESNSVVDWPWQSTLVCASLFTPELRIYETSISIIAGVTATTTTLLKTSGSGGALNAYGFILHNPTSYSLGSAIDRLILFGYTYTLFIRVK
ncbi:hypothetical protein GQ53DRAFT_824326 [Thozetella sp. PMI_491]|nr:hypothetical protein GQ53DRAFT_824326 [Thozetella sp. PMI_491]